MGSAPAVDSALRRRLRPGSVALISGLGVVLAVGLVSAVLVTQLTTHGARPAQGTPERFPVAGSATATSPPVVIHSVRYELSCDGAVNITYVVEDADIAQVAEAGSPWSVSVSWQARANSALFYSLSAEDGGLGTLKCRITVDGTVLTEGTVSGPNGVLRCSKTVG
jgi:hypothetical protein